MRRLALLLLVPVLAACSWRPFQYRPEEVHRAAPPPVAVSPAVPPCVQGARITVGETDGASGLRATGIELHNCGKQAFSVDGYPVVEVLDAERVRLDVQAIEGVDEIDQWAMEPERVAVQPGESVQAVLVWRNLTTGTAVTGAFLKIAAAAGQPAHELAKVVDLGSTGRVQVSPWVAGR